MTAVAKWPSYLLRQIPADTRAAMSVRAEQDDVSLADVVRLALCARYRADCDPASFGYQPALDTNNDILLIRIQPAVWKALKREAGMSRTTPARYGLTKQIILEAIDHYLTTRLLEEMDQ